MHWYKLKNTYLFNSFFFFAFLLILTIHGSHYVDIFQCDQESNNTNFKNTSSCQELSCHKGSWRHNTRRTDTLDIVLRCLEDQTNYDLTYKNSDVTFYTRTGYVLIVIWIFLVMRELNQIFWFWRLKKIGQYISLQNMVELLIFSTTLGFFFNRNDFETGGHLLGWAMLCSWINFTLYLSIFDFIGTRLYMALYVVQEVIISMLVYIPSIIGFATAFHCFLAGQATFHSVIMSFLEAVVMMVGETKFEDNFSYDKVRDTGGRNYSVQVIRNECYSIIENLTRVSIFSLSFSCS